MPKQGRQRGNEQLQTIKGELGITLVQFVDALGSQGDASCCLAKEVGHFVALARSDSFFTVHNTPRSKKEIFNYYV